MERMLVGSGDLKSVGYDDTTRILEIEFLNGDVYRYYAISPELYQSMINAASRAIYFDTNIKNSFDSERII